MCVDMSTCTYWNLCSLTLSELFHAQSVALEDTINSREADTTDTLKIYMVLNDLLLNCTQV